jgi:hypothetical protein
MIAVDVSAKFVMVEREKVCPNTDSVSSSEPGITLEKRIAFIPGVTDKVVC